MTRKCLHLTGPSGVGTSTLGRALAERLSCPWYDTDDFYWLPTEPAFPDASQTRGGEAGFAPAQA